MQQVFKKFRGGVLGKLLKIGIGRHQREVFAVPDQAGALRPPENISSPQHSR